MNIKLGLVILLCCLLSACQKPDTHDSHGNPITMTDLRGKWLVINYWAPWCKPCLKEMPELNTLYVNNKKKLVVIGVSYDQLSNEDMNIFAKKIGINFPLTQTLPMEKFGVTEISTLPVTFIISPQGKLIKTFDGPQTLEAFEAAIES